MRITVFMLPQSFKIINESATVALIDSQESHEISSKKWHIKMYLDG